MQGLKTRIKPAFTLPAGSGPDGGARAGPVGGQAATPAISTRDGNAMPTLSLPRLRRLKRSQLGEDSYHSLLISLLRGLAALQVAAAHTRAEFFPSLRSVAEPTLWYQMLAFLTGFAHQSVVLFFLISGWLVGGSLLNKLGHPEALKLYAIDRITRLWTVMIPTFALIIAVGILTGTLNPRSIDFAPANPYSWTALGGNLIGLQTVTLPEFGGNYPLWSLANESWYYLMFPLLMLGLDGRHRIGMLGALALAAAVLPFAITLYFAIWLLGAAFSRLRLECGAATRVILLLLLAGLSVYFRFEGSNDDLVLDSFGQDLLLSLVFLPLLSSTVIRIAPGNALVAPVRKLANGLSNFSFTLYVVHVPALGVLAWLGVHFLGRRYLAPDKVADLLLYLGMVACVLLFAYGFYRLFESRTGAIRRATKRLLLGSAQSALPGCTPR